MYDDLVQKGRDMLRRLGMPDPEKVDPQQGRRTTAVLFGDVWSDDRHLALQERSLVTLVCLITTGGVEEPLRHHLRVARRLGIPREKIEAVITHLNFYTGYPKSASARTVARSVFAEEDEASPRADPG